MSIEELLDILRHGNLSEIDTFDAAIEVESVISQLRELHSALYEANRKNDELTDVAMRKHEDRVTAGHHTPGPWFPGRALRGGQECIVGDGDSVVCFMPDRTIGCTFVRDDALLIAAAPKLLEALRKAEAALSDIGDADREPGDDVAWCEKRAAKDLPRIRAAIAAATGETK